MLLYRSLAGLVLTDMPQARSFHQRRMRRSLPVVPDRRISGPVDSSNPPRILVKSFWALQKLESGDKRDAPSDLRDAPTDLRDAPTDLRDAPTDLGDGFVSK